MKKLLNTLYVLSADAYLSVDGENVVVNKGDAVAGRFPAPHAAIHRILWI